MSLKQETQVIDGVSLTCTQFPAMRSFSLFAKLVKTIGPALTVLSTANPDSDVADIAPALAASLRDVDPAVVSSLAVEVLCGTTATIDGVPVPLNDPAKIDAVFNGKVQTMFRALAFAVKVNYGDFTLGAQAAPSA